MAARVGWFVLGVIAGLVLLGVGAYLFLISGGVSMATTSPPLPLEARVARLALRASIGDARGRTDPLPLDDANLRAGARVYHDHCAGCHGVPGHPNRTLAAAMFPRPPQIFESRGMVTDDPEGVTFWKVTHGIRLSGMPGFGTILLDTERWQVTMLLAHADRLPGDVRAILTAP